MSYSVKEIASILNCDAHINNDDRISILLTDSRSLTYAADTLFFAIKTEGNDGHRYIKSLYDKGVRNFVVENNMPDESDNIADANFLIVNNPTSALQLLATHHRLQYNAPLVAITGSRGKTTLKEWLFQLLEPSFRIVRSPRSYNSQIGVPLSLWELDDDTELALIEAGISQHDEMSALEKMISPDYVIMTNIGDEHADGFADINDKAQQKAVLAKNAKCIIYNADNKIIARPIEQYDSAKKIGWSQLDDKAYLFISTVEKHDNGSTTLDYVINGCRNSITLPYCTDADIENVVNSIALMSELGIDGTTIKQRIAKLKHIGTRLNVSEGVNNCSIIYDSYTSDYGSLWSALDFMSRRATTGQSRTLIVSDLHHETLSDECLFENMARLVARASVSRVIAIGNNMQAHRDVFARQPEIKSVEMFADTDCFMSKLSTSDFANELILIKGAPEFNFERIAENLEARTHETVLEVNLDAVAKNFNYFRRHLNPDTGLVAMVKASGYGAGSYEIAKTLQDRGAAYLAVAVLDEGIDLRKAGITMPIMVMNPKVVNYKSMFAYHLEPEIYCMEMLEDVIREAGKYNIEDYPVHIKLDTGMHRMGFNEEELPQVMRMLNSQHRIVAATTFSHLATADCPDMNDYTLLQLDRFKHYTDYMQANYPTHIKRHILNTAGILRYPEHQYDLARLGIGLYGVNTLPVEMEQPLEVVSTLRTVIISIKERKKGETIGYSRKGVLKRDSKIATIPIGYADGMNRHFGCGNVEVWINGKFAPTIGNICMDACMIDVTEIDCRPGDYVEIFGRHASVHRLAKVLDTIPYEVLTSVSPRVKRIYYRE